LISVAPMVADLGCGDWLHHCRRFVIAKPLAFSGVFVAISQYAVAISD
jgi:hypothetical protein